MFRDAGDLLAHVVDDIEKGEFEMNNNDYLDSIGVTGDARERCLEAMAKYGDNHWWEQDVDPRQFAYYQIQEPITLANDFGHFHEAIELLLGRPVYTHEFAIRYEELVAEAQRAWKYQVGVTSDRERTERVTESIKSLEEWAEQNNKQLFHLPLPSHQEQDL